MRGVVGLAIACGLFAASVGCKKAQGRADMQDDHGSTSSSAPGVFEDRVVFGTTAVFRGPEAEKGAEFGEARKRTCAR